MCGFLQHSLLLTLQNTSGAVDLWSAGCILAELLEGKQLFKGDNHINQVEVIFKVIYLRIPPAAREFRK